MEEYSFRTPEDRFRGLDLWMVNDRLEDEEIERQVKEFKDKGLYSVIFRTYNGLISDYPGPAFKHKVRVAVETAKKCGLKITLQAGYMPSAYPGLPDEYKLHRIVPIAEEELTGSEKVLIRYEGFAFCDVLAPAAINMLDDASTEYYIRTAYDEMWDGFTDEFGKTIVSVWVDEPRFDNRYMTWEASLESKFSERYGYSITENIPALYYDIGDYKKIRYDYYTFLRETMEKCYYSRIRDWCHSHKLNFSGHLMGEERLSTQITQALAIMPFYKYFDIPGIDMLGAEHDWYDKAILSIDKEERRYVDRSLHIGAVQLVSAAEQAGKELALCEMYGVTSPNFVFRDQMHLFDFFAANGINHQCMHALFYSPRGFRKRFYPQTFNVYQPFWENFRNVKDYVARISNFVSMGHCTKDVLLLHPLETAYGLCRGLTYVKDLSPRKVLEEYDRRYYRLITGLYSAGIPFHFGDMASMETLGDVEGSKLVVGKMSYSTVVVSDIEVLTEKTLRLLLEFAKNGGRLIFCGEKPSRVEGGISEKANLLSDVPHEDFDTYDLLIRALMKSERNFHYECSGDAAKTIVNYRADGKRGYYFVHNGDLRRTKKGTLSVKGMHRAWRYNAETDALSELPTRFENGATAISFENVIGGSACIITEECNELSECKAESLISRSVALTPSAEIEGENVLTLELCRYKTENMSDFSEKPIAIERVVEKLKREKYEGEVTLQYRFFSDFKAKNLRLITEDPEEYTGTINGVPFELTDCGWYYSKAYRVVKLPDAVVKGVNVLELTRYTKPQITAAINDNMTHLFELFRAPVGVDIERVHLLGDFHVEAIPENSTCAGVVRLGKTFFLTQPKKIKAVCDFTSNGYPFYPGRITYTVKADVTEELLESKDISLKIGEYNGCSALVTVNGVKTGSIDREPYSLSLKEALKVGENLISVKLYGTFRNMIGPSHVEGLDPSRCNRNTWIDCFGHTDCTEYDIAMFTNSFQLTPFGIGDLSLEFTE